MDITPPMRTGYGAFPFIPWQLSPLSPAHRVQRRQPVYRGISIRQRTGSFCTLVFYKREAQQSRLPRLLIKINRVGLQYILDS